MADGIFKTDYSAKFSNTLHLGKPNCFPSCKFSKVASDFLRINRVVEFLRIIEVSQNKAKTVIE